jgi:hypothetical protein
MANRNRAGLMLRESLVALASWANDEDSKRTAAIRVRKGDDGRVEFAVELFDDADPRFCVASACSPSFVKSVERAVKGAE